MTKKATLTGLAVTLLYSQICAADGLNFGFGDASSESNADNNEPNSGFSLNIGRDQDDGVAGEFNQIDYTAPEPVQTIGTTNGGNSGSTNNGDPINAYNPANPYPDNNYRPSTPSAPVGPSNIFDAPTANTCRAAVVNYAKPYVESYQASPSLNSKCGFQQLMEFNFFDSFSLSGLIDGAFCGFARSIVNPLVDMANEQISTINSYIPSNAELTLNGRWELNEDGALDLGADWSIYGGQAVSGLFSQTEGSYQYTYDYAGYSPEGNVQSDTQELLEVEEYLRVDPVSIEGGANLGENEFTNDSPSTDFGDYFDSLNSSEQENSQPNVVLENDTGTPADSSLFQGQTTISNNGNASSVESSRINLGGTGNTTQENSSPTDANGNIDWGDSFFGNFFSGE
ncbi:hypothetical protein [Reinekea sp. G2M2-21]|uniref:hypothetical protein n=1 Tax=Reinekea sp. G2M2-21 TaxID=2788942 RepID=UPI0018AAEEFF|nr:hypothetical protein [Reinekea sp. G2M2-21]